MKTFTTFAVASAILVGFGSGAMAKTQLTDSSLDKVTAGYASATLSIHELSAQGPYSSSVSASNLNIVTATTPAIYGYYFYIPGTNVSFISGTFSSTSH